jgi:hypothetical protein
VQSRSGHRLRWLPGDLSRPPAVGAMVAVSSPVLSAAAPSAASPRGPVAGRGGKHGKYPVRCGYPFLFV